MSGKPLSASSAALIWFGASVSVTEIAAGTLFAPLGWERGMLAQILGHLIGGVLFFAAAYIGAVTGKSSMESVRLSFGRRGSVLFSAANVLQLIGWTAVMVYYGATVSAALGRELLQADSYLLWALAIGALIVVWLLSGARETGRLKVAVVSAMLLVMLWLSWKVFGATPAAAAAPAGEMSFGTAVELSAAMPLSWLPLAADYTRNSQRPVAASAASAVSYTLTSCWMYALGLAAALFTGQSDAAAILLGAGLVTAGVFVVVVSTVTTAFLDTYSAGVSANNIWRGFAEIPVAVAVTLLGTALAVFLTMSEYEGFLLLIASVFAPMAAVLITDFFVMKRRDTSLDFDWAGLAVWLAGFVLYRYLLAAEWESGIGLTAPVMAAVAALTVAVRLLTRRQTQ
ncbi:Cytosine permease [Kingella potus]|uniref:Cytosine permease n=1 Tax=Kingella potus TaxID=265175 RepID=A0A377R232_9NEIS|nr:putative hydroxymethylpyrimidine transporter CytX [Kingella potus]STR00818.1 Cytosine permease [Kingella potus]